MSKSRLLALMGLVLVVMGVVGGYLWVTKREIFTGRSVVKTNEINVEEILEEARLEPFDSSKAITKMIFVENKQEEGVDLALDTGSIDKVEYRYFIRGILLEDMRVEGGLLGGKFYIGGDTLKRGITLTAGTADGKIYFGNVEDKEDGGYDSSWKMMDSEFAATSLKEGEEIYMEVVYEPLVESEEYVKKTKVLEALVDDIENSKGKYELPKGFGLMTLKIGVVE